MINPKDMGWLLNMKLLLCNEYCLMLVLTYMLMHKKGVSSCNCIFLYRQSCNGPSSPLCITWMLLSCPWAPEAGYRCPALPGRWWWATVGVQHGCDGWELWPGAGAGSGRQWMPPFRAESWKGTIVICIPPRPHPMTWCVEPFTVDPGTDDRAGMRARLLASSVLQARIKSSWVLCSSLQAPLLLARRAQCRADQCDKTCRLVWNTQRRPRVESIWSVG